MSNQIGKNIVIRLVIVLGVLIAMVNFVKFIV